MFFCHRLPERSFFYKGKQFPICARCTGILVGYVIGIIFVIFNKNLNNLSMLLLLRPLIIDGTGQFYGKWISNNKRRLVTGILAGIATIYFFKLAAILGISHGKHFSVYLNNSFHIKK